MRLALAAVLGGIILGPISVMADTVAGWPAGITPRVPLNFRVQPYARGLDGVRALLVLPNGDVLVAESRRGPARAVHRVTLLRDTAAAGVADQSFVLTDDLEYPFGLGLRRDRLTVGAGESLWSCPYLVGQARLHGSCKLQAALAGGEGAALAWHPDEGHLVVATEPTAAGPGALYTAHAEAHSLQPVAGRLGAVAGVAFSSKGDLWTTLSDAAASGATPVGARAISVPDTPAAGRAELPLGAHGAPRALLFYGRTHFPLLHRGALFVATDESVLVAPFAGGKPTGAVEEFMGGFASVDGAAPYGRPTALAVGTDGALLVADDTTIWRVTFKCAACTPDPVPARPARKPRS